MYDWVNPTRDSSCISSGWANASARKISPGSSRFSSAMAHSQNAIGLVCGLSTRNVRMPRRRQMRIVSASASHSDDHAGVSKARGTMSW